MVSVSDKNMDDLLAQLKAEFDPKPEPKPKSKPPASTPPRSTSSSMDRMLDELRKELESGRGRPNREPAKPATSVSAKPQQTAKDAAKARQLLNALIDTDYRRQAHKREQKRAEIERKEKARLAELKRQEEVKQAELKRRQQELIEIQKREELRNRRRREALKEDAKKWLEKLNPRSEEGRWFEEFSYSYENKLQAAIDYLEAMRETGL